MMDPVQMKTLSNAAACLAVGANCRRGEQADAIGLKLGPNGHWRIERREDVLTSMHRKRHGATKVQDYRREITPLLLLYDGYMRSLRELQAP
jgi:hypothetical protein